MKNKPLNSLIRQTKAIPIMENILTENNLSAISSKQESILATLRRASKKIAPVWPLESFVAVNPYLGLTNQSFDNAALELAVAGGIQMTLPSAFYLQKIEEGTLKPEHIAEALKKKNQTTDAKSFIEQLQSSNTIDQDFARALTFAEVTSKVTKKDWNRFFTHRISNWAASYFDHGQAIWSASSKNENLFTSWKKEAEVDFSPELSGLKNFRKQVKAMPNQPLAAAEKALEKLGIPKEGLDTYLHCLLLRVGGWSAYAARLDWDNELHGSDDGILIEFLAVLLSWEAAIQACMEQESVKLEWNSARKSFSEFHAQKELNEQLTQKLILQEAFDIASQEEIINKFKGSQKVANGNSKTIKAQAIFCIDVRSEVYRRNLELVDQEIDTLGFAGFFAFPIKYVPIGHEEGENNCPVLLKTGPTILEELPNEKENEEALNNRILRRQVQQTWKSFRSGAISCFSFVSPIGMSYLPKLFTDSFGLTRPVPHPDQFGLKEKFSKKKQISLNTAKHNQETAGIPLEAQIQMAKNALNAMSLTDDFAKLVLIVGHGSSMVNNPHATGYDCGACGGHTGEANAKVAAAVLNNRQVRAGLQKENIFIPVDTVFLACLHDTTTDEVSIYNEHEVPSDRSNELSALKTSLKLAGQAARTERASRLTINEASNSDQQILSRSKDWSQTRPEWGLAGCSAFVVAPRERTKGIDLGGQSFLHSYDWKKDESFSVLELIMTAPMVVTSWINLQYYASTVDNKVYGSGNKTLHNVTGGLGVLEGFSGDLRVGLPWQAVHDGEKFQHEPIKLNVIIEAPMEAMNNILKKHKGVKDLCDNNWINLLTMNKEGKVDHRYAGNLKWEKV